MEPISLYTKNKILEQFHKSQNDLANDVDIIKAWLKTQPHLPEEPSTNMIEFFLVSSKFSMEITKQKLDMYYTIRSIYPDFFKDLNPKSSRMKAHFDDYYMIPLPKFVDEMYRVTLIKVNDVTSEQWDTESVLGKAIQLIEVRLHEDLMFSDIVIIDCQHFQMGHVIKCTPMHVKMSTAILERVYSNRIKEIHIVNYHSVFDYILKLTKLFVKPKLYEKIRLHKTLDSLQEYIPLKVLPRDYGGDELPLNELQELWRTKFKEYENRFDILDMLKVNEALRPTPMKDLDSFGIDGTFKKLTID